MPKWKSVQDAFASFWEGRKTAYCFQFHDAREAMGAAGSRRVFTTAHPSDFLVTDKGEMYYAEVKSSENETSFPFSNIKKSQWNAAIRQTAAGGKYFFFLYANKRESWYKLDARFLLDIYHSGRKSVGWAELTDFLWTPPTSQ